MRAAAQLEPLGQSLPRLLEDFLAGAQNAVVIEDGEAIFNLGGDLADAHYSISAERGRCLLHLWSSERNAVRRVLAVEQKSGVLRLQVQRFGQAKPSRLEICLTRDQRSPSSRKAARSRYQRRLHQVLEREFIGWRVEQLTSSADLERSFGPIYARGVLCRGQSAFAVLGVNAQETQAAIDSSVAFGVLWLERCREHLAERTHIAGLKLVVPRGTAAVAALRVANLHPNAAQWGLYEFDERTGEFVPVDCADHGNIGTRLVEAPDEAGVRSRFAATIERVQAAAPQCDVAVISAAEVAFRVHGLEFARARFIPGDSTFRLAEEIVFGIAGSETKLTDASGPAFLQLAGRINRARRPDADRNHPLFRMHPERWLETWVARDIRALDSELNPAFVYSQVPAFAASDRAMIDLLSVTRSGRLAVIELKADEDPQLPLQGVDYWSRVKWHHERGEFQRFGYFPGVQLSPEPPLLMLAAPALHLHPTTDTLLRYLDPRVDVQVIGLDERWREQLKVVFRKRRATG